MEENEEKDIKQLAERYNRMLSNVTLPEMDVDDLLDLTDYYTRNGMDFEAEIYKRLAACKFPTHPDVILMCAHWEMDEGRCRQAKEYLNMLDANRFDQALFNIDRDLRMMKPRDAYDTAKAVTHGGIDLAEQDFLFDTAELFRDFGYMEYALGCLKDIPADYTDYAQVLELAAECRYFMGDLDRSAQCLEQAIDANPFDDYLWAQAAMVQYQKGDYTRAEDACEYALAINKESPRALLLKELTGERKALLEGTERKAESPETVRTPSAEDFGILLKRGEQHLLMGNFAVAEQELRLAGLYCPRASRDRVRIVFCTAYCRLMLGRPETAVETFLSLTNQGVELWPLAGDLLRQLLKYRHYRMVTPLLLPLLRLEEQPLPRLEELAERLARAECFRWAAPVWRYLMERGADFDAPHRALLERARTELEAGDAAATTEE